MKRLIAILTAFFVATSIFALPGFSPFINDMPGEYVYYRDETFARESYIGFLTYDQKTYAARYYAPADKELQKPELNLTIYFTIDASKNYIELTGEKIISAKTPDDTEILNYLHDMIYELNARRIKVGNISPKEQYTQGENFIRSGIRKNDDFMQFGGIVTIVYDYLIPLFNIKSIESVSGVALFRAVTAGRIQSSSDTSFEDFKGFPAKYQDNGHDFKRNKKATPVKFNYTENLTITLDSMWQQSMENLWLCKDLALLATGVIPPTHIEPQDKEQSQVSSPFIIRQLLQSTSISYIDLNSVNIKIDKRDCIISAIFFQSDTKNVTLNIKNLKESMGNLYFLSLTTFKNIYDKNKRYFDDILKNVEIK